MRQGIHELNTGQPLAPFLINVITADARNETYKKTDDNNEINCAVLIDNTYKNKKTTKTVTLKR